MDVQHRVNQIIADAGKVHANGAEGYTRAQTARLLGLNQMLQFDKQKTLRLDVGCWMLSQLSKAGLEAQENFINEFVLPQSTPGEAKDLDVLNSTLDKSRVKDALRQIVIDVLHHGKSVKETGLTGIKKQNLQKVLEGIKADLNKSSGKSYPISKLSFRLGDKLKEISPLFFIQFVTQSSKDRIERVLEGEAALEGNELATLYLATLLPKSKLGDFEAVVAAMLRGIERFKFDYYILIKKLSPILVEGSNPVKPPLWVQFFDHDSRAKAPRFTDLFAVYQKVQDLKKLSSEEIRKKLQEFHGKDSRIRVFQFGKVDKMVESGECTLSEAHKRINSTVDVGQFYRTYKKWQNEWSYIEYWRA
jgi:hypothetical protein